MLFTKLTAIALLAAAWCWTTDAAEADQVLYNVACPDQTTELKCADGAVIDIDDVSFGALTDADCAARDKAISDVIPCLTLLELVAYRCDGETECQLEKTKDVIDICSTPEDTFMQIGYACVKE